MYRCNRESQRGFALLPVDCIHSVTVVQWWCRRRIGIIKSILLGTRPRVAKVVKEATVDLRRFKCWPTPRARSSDWWSVLLASEIFKIYFPPIVWKPMMKGFANNSLQRKENCFNYCFGESNYPTSSLPRDEENNTKHYRLKKQFVCWKMKPINIFCP